MIIDDLLSANGIEFIKSSKKGEIVLNCPFCEENGETRDTRTRLGINVIKGLAHCYNCGWRSSSLLGIVRELCRAHGLTLRRRNLREDLAEAEKEIAKLEELKANYPEETGYPEGYRYFSQDPESDWEDDEKLARKYIASRGITRTDIIRYRLGYGEFGRLAYRVIFPVIGPQGKIYGAVGRDFTGLSKAKYLNTPGHKLLWNGEESGDVAVVCEGIVDAIHVAKAIDPGMTAKARLGSAITEAQLEQLKRFKKGIVFPDFDEAGVKAVKDLADQWSDSGVQTFVVVPTALTGQDPGDMTGKEIRGHLAQVRPWSKLLWQRLRILAATKGTRECLG